jgi:hypothetical protein
VVFYFSFLFIARFPFLLFISFYLINKLFQQQGCLGGDFGKNYGFVFFFSKVTNGHGISIIRHWFRQSNEFVLVVDGVVLATRRYKMPFDSIMCVFMRTLLDFMIPQGIVEKLTCIIYILRYYEEENFGSNI